MRYYISNYSRLATRFFCVSKPRQIRTGSLYGSIRRMIDAGLIEETSERPDPELDDERRRYYRLTTRGRRAAEREALRLEATAKQARAKLRLRKA